MKVAVADDHPDVLETTIMVLELLGHTGIAIQRVPEILERLAAERPDVLLQDISMPQLAIESHLDAIHALEGHPKVVLFSGHLPDSDLEHHPVVSASLVKPFQVDELEQLLNRLAAQ